MTSPAITIRGLHKHYGPKRAVDGLDLDIPEGEVFALLGPNGAGKSTTIEILEGFRRRTSGDVSVLGIDPQHAGREWRSSIGLMLQSTSDRSFLTAREALTHASRLYPNPRDVDETLAAIGLTDKAEAKPQTLSGGQRRRLDVGLAVIGNPRLVFLDEPTTGFDPEARRSFWGLIQGLASDGTTVLLTTHYLDEAEYLADRIGIINNGRLIALDTPAKLRARASAAVVAWEEGGARKREETAAPTAVVQRLAEKFGGEIPGLTVTHPSLEDVYLSLIGEATADESALRDQEAAA
ncbi:ABC transporter ATP-binding protein [Demequina sp. TTPB684]|uniref:ABC transporter ATP-binding protein n=1 Tax=unclassified Demequina TaxID=2620311 RepID=UPI001CF294E2|nr:MULTISPECIES: ABC transporter ATP-binding protein [unclassified Demequina]MCB2413201.1 ABC transporter ATP-binding protein [Demequina sp. TTPB684]UPU88376.1 ABC transporter ATP-binding protein [Demequina sp. TMPB413]